MGVYKRRNGGAKTKPRNDQILSEGENSIQGKYGYFDILERIFVVFVVIHCCRVCVLYTVFDTIWTTWLNREQNCKCYFEEMQVVSTYTKYIISS